MRANSSAVLLSLVTAAMVAACTVSGGAGTPRAVQPAFPEATAEPDGPTQDEPDGPVPVDPVPDDPTTDPPIDPPTDPPTGPPGEPDGQGRDEREQPRGQVTLAFAGDMHFELHLAALLDRPRDALGAIAERLRAADIAMVNLETAVTRRGTPEPKDFHFRTAPPALDVLDQAGVDVVSLANNHAVDYGPVGLRDTLAAARRSPVPVIGIGADQEAAFRPYRVSLRGTDFSFFAANTKRERTSQAWSAGPGSPGIASAVAGRPRALGAAVRRADARGDVVVVYLHWGTELQECPGAKQQVTARFLARAGADVVVGTHAHVLLGSGWLGRTYVNYGLANFLWYHDHRPESGVLELRVRNGEVVADEWVPALIGPSGIPVPLAGEAAAAARGSWEALRGCAGLAGQPPV
jgi:poly-gamma-glutamate synthesis protein (capsule biosynthesis protein)